MRRLLSAAVLLAGGSAIFSAQVPKPETDSERFLKAVGTAVQPVKGCEFAFDGKTLTAKLPKEPTGRDVDFRRGMRTEKEVNGDFELTVAMRTTAPRNPVQGKGKGDRDGSVGGGLAVWSNGDEATSPVVAFGRRFLRERVERDGPLVWTQSLRASYPKIVHESGGDDPADPQGPLHLRLTRSGKEVSASYSRDGEKWTEWTKKEVAFGKSVNVGAWAFNDTAAAVEVVFEKFALRPLK